MCGIVGMSFRENVSFREREVHSLKRMFTEMLVSAQKRGAAATGVAMVGYEGHDKRPKVFIARSPLPAEEFVKTKEYTDLLERLDNRTLSIIGHTRAPSGNTASAADNKNNHPFVHGPIVGVHNGRFINDDEIWKALAPDKSPKSQCDSEAIFALIDYYVTQQGMDTESAVAEAIGKMLGWMAIAMVNAKEPHKVYLFHDRESPLEVAFWPWVEVALFASEYSYIESGLKIANAHQQDTVERLVLDPQQLVALDSTLRGSAYGDFFMSSRRIKEDRETKEKVLAENKDSYETTQGR